jgi:hypothetical protein
VERTFFDIPNLTLHFTQVVSRILFYNEMLINFDHDANRITLGGSPKSKVCRHLKAEGQFALKERRKQRRKHLGVDRHGDWQNQFSPVIILVLFVSLFYFWVLKFELVA